MSLAKEFIEARNIKIPTDVKQLVKIMDDYASMMIQLDKEESKEIDKEQKQSDYMRGWNDGYQNKVKNPFNDNPKSE